MGRLFGILTIMNQIPILFILFLASDRVAQDTETSKSYYIFSEKQDKTLINNTGDKRYLKDPSSKWLYSGNANAYAAGVANELANEAADIFQSFDTKTGAYTLKNEYSAFGPQKAND